MKRSDESAAGGLPVAVVGIGCRFPGGITDTDSFWRLLSSGVDAIGDIPSNRIDVDRFYDPSPATPGRMMSRWGGYLDHIEDFDADFFGISARDAQYVDPQHRVLLEIAYEALEDAGQDLRALDGSSTSVFVGQWTSDFESRLFADPEAVEFSMTTGTGRYASSGRISYAFGFRGPSLTVDCACSSSLAAVHLALQSIRCGESAVALAGGVNIILQPQISVGYSQSRMMAADGRCKFGSAHGDGYVRSEGAGIVVLKPLERALADGDRIYAVIRGSAVNNDGRSSGVLGRPSRVGHEELLRAAYRDAGVSASRVGYIEAHGTGTRAGDPVELAALGAVLGEGRSANDLCLVGSVKTNFGHTEAAAGIAGLIKAALALHHGLVPPSLHLVEANPAIPWSELPVHIPTVLSSWPESDGARIAGVNSFGISGTNAHVVLQAAPSAEAFAPAPTIAERRPSLLLLSAKREEALRELAARYAGLLESEAAPAMDDLCWSAGTRRTPLACRAAFVAADRLSMADALRRYAGGEAAMVEGVAHAEKRPLIAFVFPGQGAQWPGMGAELLAREPVFREALQHCDVAARPWFDCSIVEQLSLEPGAPGSRLDRIDVIQPVLVAMEIAYAALLRSVGIEPDIVIGHSMGEVGAAHVAGVLTLEQAMQIVCRRSALMRGESGKGAMAVVELSWQAAEARLATRGGRISVAVSNSPNASVVSGDEAEVHAFIAELESEGTFSRLVNVDVASHSPHMDSAASILEAELAGMAPGPAAVPVYSTVHARVAGPGEQGAAYWAANMRRPVMFGATVAKALADDVTVFIELGPHPILVPSIQQTVVASGREAAALSCGHRDQPQQQAFVAACGALACNGQPLDWRRLMPQLGARVALPSYPWQRERYWPRAAEVCGPTAEPSIRIDPPGESERKWLHKPVWVRDDREGGDSTMPGGRDTWLLVGRSRGEAAAVVDCFEAKGWAASFVPLSGLEAALSRDRVRVAGIVLLGQTAMAEGPYAPIGLLQSVLSALRAADESGSGDTRNRRLDPRLWLVTRGAQQVASRPRPRLDMLQGAMWGAARVIAEEQPELWSGMVDLDPDLGAESDAGQLVAELTRGAPGSQVAFREQDRFVFRLQPYELEVGRKGGRWSSGASCLVTGGLGGIGLRLSSLLVDLGVRRLVLMGRSGLPPRSAWREVAPESSDGRRIAAIRALESRGASVHLLQADVSQEGDLRRVLDQYEREGWPPIRSVVHAAGLVENGLAHDMHRATFDRVFAPKVNAAALLDRLLPDLEAFFLFSSISALVGVPGMANYAAANAGMDTLAWDRRARGEHALSIQWCAWRDTGVHASGGAAGKADELERRGISEIAPDDALRFFAALAGCDEAVVTVMPVDLAVMLAVTPGAERGMFAGRFPAESGAPSPEEAVPRLLAAAASEADRRMILIPLVREAVGAVLKIPPARLDARRTLGTMGLSSLMAMELRKGLEARVGRLLSATIAWNYPTIDALVGFLAELPQPRPPAAPRDADPPMAEMVAVEDEISDEEVAELLRRKPRGTR